MKIEDLDTLKPESKIVRLGGNDIDVSFIPCGITFEIDDIMQELNSIGADKISAGGEATKRALDLSIELCVVFCSHKYPKMDRGWFNNNIDTNQIQAFVMAIRDALVRAYAGIPTDDNSKNRKAPKKK